MRAIGRRVVEPVLHVHAGLRAFEEDMAVHDRHMMATRDFRNYG